ncbi:MAG TPA: hypothetical protein VLM40_09775 [Gemmata sp.]|nr:hypothetical protein [Gemmata sp.]
MERARPYLKVAAVLCSVCLVAAFVAYRAGAFDRLPPPAPAPAAEVQPPAAPESQTPSTFLAGSKSTFVFDPAKGSASMPTVQLQPSQTVQQTQGTPPAPASKPTFIGGSKSLTPLFGPVIGGTPDKKTDNQPAQPAAPAQKGDSEGK